jgi:predicted SAM-dependent methyltransferase
MGKSKELAKKLVITVGAYHNRVEGSIGIGIDKGPATDQIMDMRELKFADNTVDAIYSFDTVEHIPIADQEKVFQEMFRVLKPGGYIEISTIDLPGVCREFLAGDSEKRRILMKHIYGGQEFPGDFHYCGYDEELLVGLFKKVGFENAKRREGGPSKPWGGSLSVEATK